MLKWAEQEGYDENLPFLIERSAGLYFIPSQNYSFEQKHQS